MNCVSKYGHLRLYSQRVVLFLDDIQACEFLCLFSLCVLFHEEGDFCKVKSFLGDCFL